MCCAPAGTYVILSDMSNHYFTSQNNITNARIQIRAGVAGSTINRDVATLALALVNALEGTRTGDEIIAAARVLDADGMLPYQVANYRFGGITHDRIESAFAAA